MDTLLRALPYYILTVAALGTTLVITLSVMRGLYARRILILGTAFFSLGLSFFLIAATAGPNGHTARAAVAQSIRILDTTGGLLWLLWLVLAVRAGVRVEKHSPTGE